MPKITVTQHLIDHGEIQDCSYCPVAKAIGLAVGAIPIRVQVAMTFTRVWHDPDGMDGEGHGFDRYELPPEATRFIRDFDQGYPVGPFEFELGEPEVC